MEGARVKTEWVRLKARECCKICNHAGWCSVSADGLAVMCARTPSGKRCGEAGWLHLLSAPHRLPPRQRPLARPQDAPRPDFGAMMLQWRQSTPEIMLDDCATALGVPAWTLGELGAAWAEPYKAWAYPMCDANRMIIGIRLRARDGRKWAVKGSRNGLFIPKCVPGEAAVLIICEGPTTCAALLGLNYAVIGRASCSTCVDLCAALCGGWPVIIMADEDSPKARPDGTTFRPGQDGAEALARALVRVARSVKIVYPLNGKDFRDFIRAGGSRAVIDAQIHNALYYRG